MNNYIRLCIYVTFPTKLISTNVCNALTEHERVTFLWETKLIWNIWNCYISSNLSTAIPIPVWSSHRRRKLSQWLKIKWYWPLLLMLHQEQHCTCNTFFVRHQMLYVQACFPNLITRLWSFVDKKYWMYLSMNLLNLLIN